MRTNVDINAKLLARAMRLYGLATKRETIEFALRRLVGDSMVKEKVLAMEGSGWEGSLDDMRNRPVSDT